MGFRLPAVVLYTRSSLRLFKAEVQWLLSDRLMLSAAYTDLTSSQTV